MCSTRRIDPLVATTLDQADVKHLNLRRSSKWDIYRFGALASLLRRECIDVLHAHMFGSNLWGTLIGRACRVPVVLAHEHTWSYQGDPLRRFVDGRIIGRLATRFVAVSSLDARRMVSIEGVAPEKIVVIPTAYVPRSGSLTSDLRGELGIARRAPLIGVVSVLRAQKALSVLLEAFARVLGVIPDAHLAVAGDGPCRQSLELHARGLGLDGRAHFLGYRRDIDSFLRAVDVAAMSSDYEGTPLVAFECMANRTPLVATAVGGLPDIVDDGQTGLLVPPRQPAALADALIILLEDPIRRDRIATAAAERLEEFTIDAIALRFATLYEQLVEESRVPTPAAGASRD
jgi:glycosyltransferase involved in cell wall biosynthesis